MANSKTPPNPLILREAELRRSIELLFFAYRDFTGEADAILSDYGLGRAHHRVIYFVGRNDGITVSALLDILGITKQSLSRVLSKLTTDGYISQAAGKTDRRQRLLSLTSLGKQLESALTTAQMNRFSRAYKKAGFENVDGFLRVLDSMTDASQTTPPIP